MMSKRKAKRAAWKEFKAKSKRKSWCSVYVLKDEAGTPRYVGQTRCKLSTRMQFHLRQCHASNSPVHKWMREGATKIFIEELDSDAVWDVTEAVWIDRMRRDGHDLFNVAGVVK